MKLPTLSPKLSLKGKRVFVRVDWNVPVAKRLSKADIFKIEQSLEEVRSLASRGAVVIAATHIGRPKKHEAAYSTKALVRVLSLHFGVHVHFISAAIDTTNGLADANRVIRGAKAGTIVLLENVRFFRGETENALVLAKAYASLADMYVNDGFASCHDAHASHVAITRYLPSFAGASMQRELRALAYLWKAPKKPFVAIVGGAKLTSKVRVLEALLKSADRVMVGGAMATVFFAAQKKQIGKSFVEKAAIPFAKKLLKYPKLRLPVDVVVASKIVHRARVRVARVDDIKKLESIGDIGPETMRAWSAEIGKAKTIVWNGPLGVAEIPSFAHGSFMIARSIATRSKGKAFGVVGGGEALAVALASGMSEWYDHLSSGGGALLSCIVSKGRPPAVEALLNRKANKT